jgi:MATE family multidrug resistance protein
LTLKEHYKKNFTLAYPVMLSQMGHILVNLSDSVMVGQLGTIPLASVSLAISVFSIVLLFGIGVSYGMTPLVAQADGEDDKQRAVSILKHGLILNTLFGVILMFATYGGGKLLVFMGQDQEVLDGTIPYLGLMAICMLPLMVFQSFRQFAEGLSFTKQSMIISISANVLNVILNYILIFGKFGMEPMGLMGAGWATLISRIFMTVLMGGYIIFSKRFAPYMVFYKAIKTTKSVYRNILKIGVPSGVQYIFEVGAFSAAAIMIGWLGAMPLAAHQIAMNLSAVTYMMSTGIAAAATIRIGNQLGKKDIKTLRMAGFTCFVMAAIFMAFTGIGFILGKDFLPTFYSDEIDVIKYTSSLLVIAAIFQISDGVQAVGLGVLRGISDVKVPTLITFLAFWAMSIPIGYVLGIKLEYGAQGVWVGLLVGLTVAGLLHFLRFKALTKRLLIESK